MDIFGRYFAALTSALEFHFERFWREWLILLAIILVVFGGGYSWLLAAPAQFPSGVIISVSKGESTTAIAEALGEAQVVQHPSLLRAVLRISGRAGDIHAGAYRFAYPENVLVVAYRLATNDSGIAPAKITFPEGLTARLMAVRVAQALPEITESDFISAAQPYEGYLFPDTYTFSPDSTADSVAAAMRANFDAQLEPLMPSIVNSGHSLSEIIVMASLVEKEARTPADKKMIAGILWNRIKAGMPLQVDAVFGYINARSTYSPSFDDLGIDSPYNTYTHKGLPPGPIDNPGLDSIEAAINPTPSTYIYYLTGRDGKMHYATTFAEHKANRAKYLD